MIISLNTSKALTSSATDAQISEAKDSTLTAVAVQAQFVMDERRRFEAQFPPSAANEALMPAFTWNQVERQLLDLAEEPALSNFLKTSLARCRRQAELLPPELLLREILVLAAMAQEEPPPISSLTAEEDSSMA